MFIWGSLRLLFRFWCVIGRVGWLCKVILESNQTAVEFRMGFWQKFMIGLLVLLHLLCCPTESMSRFLNLQLTVVIFSYRHSNCQYVTQMTNPLKEKISGKFNKQKLQSQRYQLIYEIKWFKSTTHSCAFQSLEIIGLGLTTKWLCKPHPTPPPHKLNISNISAVTDPILMKL